MAIRTEAIAQVAAVRWVRTQDWLTLLLVGSAVILVVRSVEVAQWVPTPWLSLTAALGALAGLLAVRLPWKAWQGHLLTSAAGVLVVYLQASTVSEAETFLDRISELNTRMVAWWTALLDNDISTDTLPFAFILTALAWAAGYVASWAVFRRGSVWLAVLPSAFGLLMNLTYLPERYYFHLFPFMLVTMLLMVRLHSVQQTVQLERQGIDHPRSLRILWLVAGLVFSSIIVGSVFLLPPNRARHTALAGLWNASRMPVEWFQGEFGRLFSAVGGKLSMSARRFGATFPILPIRPMGTDPVFSGYVSYPAYWKVRAYTTYNAGGWTSDDTVLKPAVNEPPLTDDDYESSEQGETSYQVEIASSTPYLYIPAPTTTYVSVTAQVERSDAASALTDALTMRPKKRLEPGDSYTGSFAIPFYQENLLRATGLEYPQWVKDHYLKLPASLPQRVRTLALQLTQDLTNPYDKAVAIEKYLRTNYKYGNAASPPGFNDDRVDHFLFQSKVGHSDHFASAMAVMLRAAGVPTRLVSGYGPGVTGKDEPSFTVTEGDQHSWAEAYMPQVGWVEFEPSPIYPFRPRQTSDLAGFGPGLTGLNPGDGLPGEPEDNNLEETDPGGGRLPGGQGPRPFPLILQVPPWSSGGVLLMVLMAMWVAVLVWVWRRSFLRLPNPEMAYARMHRMARLLVVEPQQGYTPREFGKALATAIPGFREDILVICDAFCRTRYGNTKLSEQEGLGLRLAWNRVQKAMVRYTLN